MTDKDIALNSSEVADFLKTYFRYYNTLNEIYKKLFVERLIEFVQSKEFVAHKNVLVDNRVKTIIAAAAIQLTLGLTDWRLAHFKTILIFPNDFINNISGLKLKGETGVSGYVSLNWRVFIEGYRLSDDNLNLGLHEFTHALKINSIMQECSDGCFSEYFIKWQELAKKEMLLLEKNKNNFLRAYGAANMHEFLSVVVEHFFESPLEFEKNLPELYGATALLLNQKTDGKTTIIGTRNP